MVTYRFALGYLLVVDSFSHRHSYCLLVYLILCPKNLTCQPPGWRSQKYSLREMWVVLHLKLEFYWLLLALRGIICFLFVFVFLFLIISESWEGRIFCTHFGMPLASLGYSVVPGIFTVRFCLYMARYLKEYF